MNKQRQNGFTILELMVVIIIIGIMASLAIPNLGTVIEKSRVGEATTILGVLRASQMRYKQEKGVYQAAGAANDPGGLDVTIDFAKYFDWFPDEGISVAGCTAAVAHVERNATSNPSFGTYILCIEENGTIRCTDGTAGGCAKLGF